MSPVHETEWCRLGRAIDLAVVQVDEQLHESITTVLVVRHLIAKLPN